MLAALHAVGGPGAVQWVVLKMLPFDNKSEFQVVVDMPAGTPLEDTAAALQEMGAYLASSPRCATCRATPAPPAPITFNGLVRQYYLRADAEQGDLQVNLVDKAHRDEQSHAIAQRLRPSWSDRRAPRRAAEGGRSAARPAGDEPAGGRGLRPRTKPAASSWPRAWQGLWRHTRHRRHRHHAARGCAARLPARAAPARRDAGHPGGGGGADGAGALSGVDAAWLHDGRSKYPVPVRLQLPRERQVGLDALLALPLRAAANGPLVPLSELVRVERGVIDKPLFTKDLQGVSYVSPTWPAAPRPTRRCTACSASAARCSRRAAGHRRAGRVLDPPARPTPTAPTPSSGTASGRSPTRPSATWAPPTAWA
jgi:hypothetical protein